MINNVVLVGRLTKDMDLRYTSSGTAVGSFTLAVNRNFTSQNGNREADYVNCVIWRKPAETMANYTRKGSLVGVVGRIQTRYYDNPQGQRVYVMEVVCERFQLLESKEVSEQRQNQAPVPPQNQPAADQSNPAGANYSPDFGAGSDPFGVSGSTIDISDDDLPF